MEHRKVLADTEIKDIFIAATAIVYDIPVFTLNKKHFERLEGVSLV